MSSVKVMEIVVMKHCCERMTKEIEHLSICDDPFNCSDAIIYYDLKIDEYGLIVHDGGGSYICIDFCPFCGAKLPESKRDVWFEKLEALGFTDLLGRTDIPPEFRTDEWYRKRP